MADNNNNNVTEDDSTDDEEESTIPTPNPSMNNIEEQLNTLVNDIFSTTEFMHFLETLHQNFLEDAYENHVEDDDDDDSTDGMDLDVEYNYFIDTITIGRPRVPSPIPIEFVHFPYEMKDNTTKEECSICLVDFETNDSVVSLKCNHLFHKTCIVEWANHKAECPNCREKI